MSELAGVWWLFELPPPAQPIARSANAPVFFYTATHEQVTRSAPPSNPTTKRYLTLTPREQKISMSWHSLLRKETNSKKQTKKRATLVWLDYYNRRQKVVNSESSVWQIFFYCSLIDLLISIKLRKNNIVRSITWSISRTILPPTSKPTQLSEACSWVGSWRRRITGWVHA